MFIVSILLACTMSPPSSEPVPPEPVAEPEPDPEPSSSIPAVEAFDAAALPSDEAKADARVIVGSRYRYQVPADAQRGDGHVWSWTGSGIAVQELTVRAWVTAEPWPDGDAESYAKHLESRHEAHEPQVDTSSVRVAGEISALPRLQVVDDQTGTLYIAGVSDGMAYTWTCQVGGKARFELALACMAGGTSFHLDPPPLPDRAAPVANTDAAPLWSVSRADWPCAATTSANMDIKYTYGDLDRCTIDPMANVASCPTRITFTRGDETGGSEMTYDGMHLVERVFTHFPSDGATVDRYGYAYEGDVLTAMTKDADDDGSVDKTTRLTQEADGTIVATNPIKVTRYARDEAGHIVSIMDGYGRRTYTWEGDRLKQAGIFIGQAKTAEITYQYDCD